MKNSNSNFFDKHLRPYYKRVTPTFTPRPGLYQLHTHLWLVFHSFVLIKFWPYLCFITEH